MLRLLVSSSPPLLLVLQLLVLQLLVLHFLVLRLLDVPNFGVATTTFGVATFGVTTFGVTTFGIENFGVFYLPPLAMSKSLNLHSLVSSMRCKMNFVDMYNIIYTNLCNLVVLIK